MDNLGHLEQEGSMMRWRYQRGCLRRAKRKGGADCWEFLWRENDATGKRVRRTAVIGTVEKYPTRDSAEAVVNGLRMQVNMPGSLFAEFGLNIVINQLAD
jgi:hypothetical protein